MSHKRGRRYPYGHCEHKDCDTFPSSSIHPQNNKLPEKRKRAKKVKIPLIAFLNELSVGKKILFLFTYVLKIRQFFALYSFFIIYFKSSIPHPGQRSDSAVTPLANTSSRITNKVRKPWWHSLRDIF